MQLTFIGGAGTVTGSKYLVETGAKKLLIDCGLFQGFKQLRLRNRAELVFNPKEIETVILTHAHIDHSGYLPLLVKKGFSGKIYCSRATYELCKLLLPDSGKLQEEEAEYANQQGYSKHKPALPLYTEQDAIDSLQYFSPVDFEKELNIGGGVTFKLFPAGHILGAAYIILKDKNTSVLFSGDIGRLKDLVMLPPARVVQNVDYLVVESTYGNRRHPDSDPLIALAEIINRTVERKGAVIIPAFAVGRAQALLYLIYLLKILKKIPDIPVYLNSPMATDVTQIYHTHHGEHRLTLEQCNAMCGVAHIVNKVEESKQLNMKPGPMIIVAASGMATGGRVLHHLKWFGPHPRNTILFTGYQAGGTRGAAIVAGAEAVKIHGEYVPIRAEVVTLNNFSAHADWFEIIEWLKLFPGAPKQAFITHGEADAADALRHQIEWQLNWRCLVPEYLQKVELN
jgi:metallo-beta-lactamase family protein